MLMNLDQLGQKTDISDGNRSLPCDGSLLDPDRFTTLILLTVTTLTITATYNNVKTQRTWEGDVLVRLSPT